MLVFAASAGISFTARQKDEKFYEALSQVEAMSGSGDIKDVIIKNETGADVKTIRVDVFTPSDTSENLAIYRER